MSKVNIQKVSNNDDRSLPIFSELDELFDKIREQAYKRFEVRGFTGGQEVEDWLNAERELCWPNAELIEEDDEYDVKVALAGFDPSDIELTATPRELIVKAVHEYEKSDKDDKVRWSDFRHNDVYRRVSLPSDVDVDKVKAEFKNGLLEIEAPKARKSGKKTKRVKVSDAT